uniref:Uncharacterized protein n=1 Tax=Arundo donax TaxID=35708 RepID=A0A0A8XQD5_ARUDO
MCALSLMDCNSSHSHAAAGAMVLQCDGWLQFKGITKETSRMCEWMRKNEQLLDIFSVSTPDELEKGRVIRFRILDVMISIVEKSSFPSAAAGNTPGSDMDGTAAAEPADTTGGDASDELNCQDQKITDADNSKKRKKKTKKQITKVYPFVNLTFIKSLIAYMG